MRPPNPYESPNVDSPRAPNLREAGGMMDLVRGDRRPNGLKWWLAFASAAFVFRVSSATGWILTSLVPPVHDVFTFPYGWRDTAIIVLAVCLSVLAELWQEGFFASKSMRVNILAAAVLTILALNPWRITIDPQLVQRQVGPRQPCGNS